MEGNTPMGKLHDEAEALGVDLDPRWNASAIRRAISRRKAELKEQEARETQPKATARVRLLKNTKPKGWYKVVGHYDAEENYVEDAPAPPPYPGVEFEHKLWAGTVVELPADEARALVENTAELVVTDRDPETRHAIGKRVLKQRKPLAEVAPDWKSIGAVGVEDLRNSA